MKTSKRRNIIAAAIMSLAVALVCGVTLAGCSGGGSSTPDEVYTGSKAAYSEPAPGYAITQTMTQNLSVYSDGTYELIVTDLSMTTGGSLLSLFHTTLVGSCTIGEVDEDTGYQTITLIDTAKVYASGDIYNMYQKRDDVPTEIWSDDASLTDEQESLLLDLFGIENIAVEVNTADNTFDTFTYSASNALADTSSSVWD